MRSMHLLPRRRDKPEWQHRQDYWAEQDGPRTPAWTTAAWSMTDRF
jgi:hypothetical protein